MRSPRLGRIGCRGFSFPLRAEGGPRARRSAGWSACTIESLPERRLNEASFVVQAPLLTAQDLVSSQSFARAGAKERKRRSPAAQLDHEQKLAAQSHPFRRRPPVRHASCAVSGRAGQVLVEVLAKGTNRRPASCRWLPSTRWLQNSCRRCKGLV